jgi:hypothetical protein
LWFRLGGYALLASPLLLLKYAGLFAVGESVFLRQVVFKIGVISLHGAGWVFSLNCAGVDFIRFDAISRHLCYFCSTFARVGSLF